MRFIFLVTVTIVFLASSDFKIDINKILISAKDYDYKDSGFALDYVFKIFKSKKYLNDKYKKKSKVIQLSKNYSNIVEFIKSKEFKKNYKNIFKVDKCIKNINITGIIYDKNSALVEIDGVKSGNVFTYFIIDLKDKKLYSYFIECEVVNVAPLNPISPGINLLKQYFDSNISNVKDFCIKNRDILKNKKSKSNKYDILIKDKFKDGSFIASFNNKNQNYTGYFSKQGKLIKGGKTVAIDDPIGKWCYYKNNKLTWVDYSLYYKFSFSDTKKMILKLLRDDVDTTFYLTKDIISNKKMWRVYNIGSYCLTLYINGINGQIEKIDYDVDKQYKDKFTNCIKSRKDTIKECIKRVFPPKYPLPICIVEPSIPSPILGFKYDREYGEYSITKH